MALVRPQAGGWFGGGLPVLRQTGLSGGREGEEGRETQEGGTRRERREGEGVRREGEGEGGGGGEGKEGRGMEQGGGEDGEGEGAEERVRERERERKGERCMQAWTRSRPQAVRPRQGAPRNLLQY